MIDPLELTFKATFHALKADDYETVGRLWPDGFGILAAGHKGREAQTVIVVATLDHVIVTPARQLIAALRDARLAVLNSPNRMPIEAAGWLTRIIEQWETDHPADRPN
jgi:hypothetical protein